MLLYALYVCLILSLFCILFEDLINLSKSKAVLFFGTLSWLLVFMNPQHFGGFEAVKGRFMDDVLDISNLWLFLVSTMTFVAYLNKKGFIDSVIHRILPEAISERSLLIVIASFAFVFSSIADNVTATLVSLSIVMALRLPAEKLIKFVVVIVFAVNSGGVAMITGDVTTLMIFLAGKLNVGQLILLSVPAASGVLVLTLLLSRGLGGQLQIEVAERHIDRFDMLIAAIFFTTICSVVLGSLYFSIPPMLIFLFGMSVMFLVSWIGQEHDRAHDILQYIREIEFETLLFFLGVLLLVGLMKELGLLEGMSKITSLMPAMTANYSIGVLSAFIDNVPMTQAMLKAGLNLSVANWMGLTYAIGVGGSLLVIGSAAGIVALNRCGPLNFLAYLRYAWAVGIAYSLGFLLATALGGLAYG
jgi:Na+/H+ antiporter NhaD/arsenite permease-like protein